MLNGIDVAFSTVNRAENYLESTLDDFSAHLPIGADNPVSLILGSPPTDHLGRYRSRAGVHVVEMGPHTWAWIKNNSVYHRATWNYYRCLTHPRVGKRGTLVFEDDVHFSRGWRERLEATITALERTHDDSFVLSLYEPHGFRADAGCLYADYERTRFFGTQGVYFPAGTRERFARYLKKNGVIADRDHYDLLLRYYTLEQGLWILACVPSLIQHTGRKTTGLGGWHFAPNFVEDVRHLPARGLA